MNQFYTQEALFASWRQCAQSGLSPYNTDKLYPLDAGEIQQLQKKYQVVIAAFHRVMSKLSFPEDIVFFLLDANGVLLEKKHS